LKLSLCPTASTYSGSIYGNKNGSGECLFSFRNERRDAAFSHREKPRNAIGM
jgi:hypothetical protein